MLSKVNHISKLNKNSLVNTCKTLGLINLSAKNFSAGNTVQPIKRVHGGLKDQDRIFTNVYCDTTPFIEGALKRVKIFKLTNFFREIGIKLKILFKTDLIGLLMK